VNFKIAEFLQQVKAELQKVTWPTRKETYGSTVVVIVLVLIVAVFLWVVDTGLSALIQNLLN
jgi:preprotein translocase subunit SecE